MTSDIATTTTWQLQEKLRPVFGAPPAHDMLLITGSGTSAMEISSVVPPGKKTLVIANGAFGDRLDEIAALQGIPRVTLRYPWGHSPTFARVARWRAIPPSPRR
jgi:2-aminoethylphosphonate-pyruvate transaminase